MRRSFTRIGLLAGPFLSLGFIIGAWGLDWIELNRVGAEWPWLRFAAGAVLCMPFGFVAGWLSGRSQSGLISILSWIAAVTAMAYIASHVPFEIASWVTARLDPRFAGLEVFPFVPSSEARQWLVIAICVPLGAITGGLFTLAIDNLYSARGIFPKTGMLILCSGLLIAGGLVSDLTTNRPLRGPLTSTHDLLISAVDNWGRELTNLEIRNLRLGVVRALGDTILDPRHIGVGLYDPEAMESMRARVDFSGRWVTCYTIAEQPTFCQYSDLYYGDFFACLWTRPENGCKIKAAEPAEAWLNANRQEGLPESQVIGQRGIYTLMAVRMASGSAICRFNEFPSLVLEACTPDAQVQVMPLPTATPRATNTRQDQLLASAAGAGQTVLNPDLLKDLAGLPNYTISLNIHPDGLQYSGELTLVYTNTTGVALEDMLFRLLPNAGQTFGPASLSVTAAQVSGSSAAVQPADDPSVLRVSLPGDLLPGQNTSVSLSFAGVVPKDFGGEDNSAYGIFNFTERVLSLSSWYPILAVFEDGAWRTDPVLPIGDAVYSEMAFYRVDITTSRHWEVAATGIAVTEQEGENSTITRRYLSGPVRDFYLVASPDFSRLTETVDGVVVNTYAMPGSREGNLSVMDVTVNSLEIFNDRFGPYPYSELDVVQVPMRNAGGVEFPGIVLIEAGRYADPQNVTLITTVAHEVAHQWWYNVVGNDIFNEPWLDEALTTYSSALYWETIHGRQAYQEVAEYWQGRVQDVQDAGKDDRITGSLVHFMQNEPRLYGAIVYNKGALFFKALREEIGDEAFFEGLQTYYQRYSFKVARGQDLLSIFEETAGRDLADFFDQWLYQP